MQGTATVLHFIHVEVRFCAIFIEYKINYGTTTSRLWMIIRFYIRDSFDAKSTIEFKVSSSFVLRLQCTCIQAESFHSTNFIEELLQLDGWNLPLSFADSSSVKALAIDQCILSEWTNIINIWLTTTVLVDLPNSKLSYLHVWDRFWGKPVHATTFGAHI